jgi:hypothetical protein
VLRAVKKASRFLDLELYQVYYLLAVGEIEAVKAGKIWRLEPEAVKEYDKRYPKKPHRKAAAHFVYPGDGGFLFSESPDYIPPHPLGETGSVEGRRKQLARRARRPQTILLKKLKPIVQLELFTPYSPL